MRAAILLVEASGSCGTLAPVGSFTVNDVGEARAQGTVGTDVTVAGPTHPASQRGWMASDYVISTAPSHAATGKIASVRERVCWRTGWALAILVGGAGCTEVREQTAVPDEVANGTRLTAEYFELDGVKVFRRWQDAERGAACVFDTTPEPDGGYHCLPEERVDLDPSIVATFEDSACTVPLFSVLAWPEPIPVVSRPPNACAEAVTVFEQGEPRFFPFFYRLDAEGNCFGEDVGAEYRPLGSEIPLASFVRAEAATEEVGEGLGRATLVADDGARQLLSAIDLAFGDRVEARDSPGGRRFTPTQVAFDFRDAEVLGPGLYADESCTSSVAAKIARTASCPITAVLVYGELDGCNGYPETFARAGALVAGESIHILDTAGRCMPSPRADGDAIFVEALEPRDIHPASMRWLGGDRILRRWDATLGGEIVVPDVTRGERFFDADWNMPCRIALDGAGVNRCLPVAEAGLGSYADAACTEPLLLWGRSEACEQWMDPPAALVEQGSRSVFSVGARVATDSHYRLTESGCQPVGALDPDVARLYRLHAVAAEQFAAARSAD